ncbi:MAG: tRNA uridine-5-carboxymethylaminomethyl(34) synthesis enzyme MnmG [Bacteroidales bacterium]
MIFKNYDVIVVGGGHAGCEAAAISANLGAKTLLISINIDRFGQMSCNPAIGGIAKGQIVREIDALGGYTGEIADKTSIQFRLLNTSKGPAVWSPRSQCDKVQFTQEWRRTLESIDNLDIWQDHVTELLIKGRVVQGVKTTLGLEFYSNSVILTNGTFLNGVIHIGRSKFSGGRLGEQGSIGLTSQLKELGFTADRLKTGTPVRIDGRTIDFSEVKEQKSENDFHRFSYKDISNTQLSQRSCFITFTNKDVHGELRKGFKDSPMFDGTISGAGPRYCPSIETKIDTFVDKDAHQLFLEPEGIDTYEYYLNGFSSSLPLEVQYAGIKKIPGLHSCNIIKPGYAIEYDYFNPQDLKHTLETRLIDNLFFAGQINGTTGYEEAAGQGLIAGINAFIKCTSKSEFTLNRDEAYIGVLIDDLLTKGVDEPYRMFTSRAEFRILLRQDNADQRLSSKISDFGERFKSISTAADLKYSIVAEVINLAESYKVKMKDINPYLEREGFSTLRESAKLSSLLLRPELRFLDLLDNLPHLNEKFSKLATRSRDEVIESVEIAIKYRGYIEREQESALRISQNDSLVIPNEINYSSITQISTEGRQKLERIRPINIGQAKRILGVSPADIQVLMMNIARKKGQK